MGVVEKLKQLHKQTLLKLSSIKRTVIAKDSGVDNEEYLNRARTLKSYIEGETETDSGSSENNEASDRSKEEITDEAKQKSATTAKSSSRSKKSINI